MLRELDLLLVDVDPPWGRDAEGQIAKPTSCGDDSGQPQIETRQAK